MKKNIFIGILILIIFILVYKILHPSVVTQRKIPVNTVSSQINDDNENTYKNQQNQYNAESPLKPEFRVSDDSSYQRNTETSDSEYYQERSAEQNSEALHTNDVYVYKDNYSNDKLGNKEMNDTDNYQKSQPKPQKQNVQNSLSMCVPYKETLTTEYMGMNMTYTIDILGWVNNKCVLNFESHMNGAGNSFLDIYGVSADSAQVYGFAPKVRCEFTKQQLLYVGDNILEENSRNHNMLKNPDQIEFPNLNEMSFSDLKLLQIILNDKACKVINSEDFMQLFEGLLQF